MANNITITVDKAKVSRRLKSIDRDRAQEFLDLVERAYRKRPNKKDLNELRKWMHEYPDLWHDVFDLAEAIKQNLIEKIVSGEAARIAIDKNISSMRQEFGYETAPVMVKLLIDNIVISWLQCQWLEYQLVLIMGNGEIRMSVVEFWERRLSVSQRRYLQACETLTKVQRLNSLHPLVQVNISKDNSQQVNVAGDLVK